MCFKSHWLSSGRGLDPRKPKTLAERGAQRLTSADTSIASAAKATLLMNRFAASMAETTACWGELDGCATTPFEVPLPEEAWQITLRRTSRATEHGLAVTLDVEVQSFIVPGIARVCGSLSLRLTNQAVQHQELIFTSSKRALQTLVCRWSVLNEW